MTAQGISNLAQLMIDRAETRPGLRVGAVDHQVDLAIALRHAAGGTRHLAEFGPDARGALVAATSTDYLLVWMAFVLAGAPVALVNPTYPPELLAEMIDNLDPDVIYTDLDDHRFTSGRPTRHISETTTWTPDDPSSCSGIGARPGSTTSYMHTSGTTGAPKFCAQSHEYFLRLGHAVSSALGLEATDRMLAPLPLFHINPMGYGIIGALTAGADALAVTRFSASGFWPTVHEHGITAVTLHSPPVEILKRVTSGADSRGHRIRTMFYADAGFMKQFGIARAVSGYGSTEAGGVSHLHRWSIEDTVPANAARYGGRSRDDIEWRLDEDGQILVREREPNALFTGYFARGSLEPARSPGGWFATGDLGRIADREDLLFLERAAESIRVKGEFVPIPYVEEQIGRIAQLDDFALWKQQADLADDEVVLYVVAESVPVAAISAVSEQLPVFMRPTRIAQVDAIPRDSAAGKIQRRLLDDKKVLQWMSLS